MKTAAKVIGTLLLLPVAVAAGACAGLVLGVGAWCVVVGAVIDGL